MTGLSNRSIFRPDEFLRPSASLRISPARGAGGSRGKTCFRRKRRRGRGRAERFFPSTVLPVPATYSPRRVGCFPRPSSDRHATAGFASANLRAAECLRARAAEIRFGTPGTVPGEVVEDEVARAARAAAVGAVPDHQLLELQHAAIHGSSGAQNSLAARSRASTHQVWTEHASELLSAGAGLMSWDLACASAVVCLARLAPDFATCFATAAIWQSASKSKVGRRFKRVVSSFRLVGVGRAGPRRPWRP